MFFIGAYRNSKYWESRVLVQGIVAMLQCCILTPTLLLSYLVICVLSLNLTQCKNVALLSQLLLWFNKKKCYTVCFVLICSRKLQSHPDQYNMELIEITSKQAQVSRSCQFWATQKKTPVNKLSLAINEIFEGINHSDYVLLYYTYNLFYNSSFDYFKP